MMRKREEEETEGQPAQKKKKKEKITKMSQEQCKQYQKEQQKRREDRDKKRAEKAKRKKDRKEEKQRKAAQKREQDEKKRQEKLLTQIAKHASMLHGEGALLRSPQAQLVATSATAERAAATASRPPNKEEGGLEIPQDISADAGNAARDLLDTSLVEQGMHPWVMQVPVPLHLRPSPPLLKRLLGLLVKKLDPR